MDYGNWKRQDEQFRRVWDLDPIEVDIDTILRPLPIRADSDFPDVPDDVPVEDPPPFPDIEVEIDDDDDE